MRPVRAPWAGLAQKKPNPQNQTPKTIIYYSLLLNLFRPQVVHRSATKLLHATLSSALLLTSSSWRFFRLISRVRVHRKVSFGLPTLLLPSGFQLRACLVILSSGILRAWLYHFQSASLIFSTTLCWPVLLHSSSSFTWSYNRIFRILLRQLLSNLRTLPSVSFSPFHDSHPYKRTDMTIILKSLNFVVREVLSSFLTFFRHLLA